MKHGEREGTHRLHKGNGGGMQPSIERLRRDVQAEVIFTKFRQVA